MNSEDCSNIYIDIFNLNKNPLKYKLRGFFISFIFRSYILLKICKDIFKELKLALSSSNTLLKPS